MIPGRPFPDDPDALKASSLFQRWWYYSVELLPGLITRGQYPNEFPMLPRIMLRRCDLRGMSCLDVGCMEGLMAVLMRRGGARAVLALDAVDHCQEKMTAVKHYHDADFDYLSTGLMYNVYQKLTGRSFDLINISGLLYHVFSPMMFLLAFRPLLKRNGLMIVSTNVIADSSYTQDFNDRGRLQVEVNTFWYLSIPLLDYLLRFLKLAPIDCEYGAHSDARSSKVRYVCDKPSGYISVVCRARDAELPTRDDTWMADAARHAWEYNGLTDWQLCTAQPLSQIRYDGNFEKRFYRPDLDGMDLWDAVQQKKSFGLVQNLSDSHTLRLSDKS
jgi:2-polyprenyl-3-methyl-5-hydroxy-6-metoxy-1,4-benzoquinol methylase